MVMPHDVHHKRPSFSGHTLENGQTCSSDIIESGVAEIEGFGVHFFIIPVQAFYECGPTVGSCRTSSELVWIGDTRFAKPFPAWVIVPDLFVQCRIEIRFFSCTATVLVHSTEEMKTESSKE